VIADRFAKREKNPGLNIQTGISLLAPGSAGESSLAVFAKQKKRVCEAVARDLVTDSDGQKKSRPE